MIPDNIDINALARDLEDDAVAMGTAMREQYPAMEEELSRIAEDAADGEFGTLGYVVLDNTPAVTADLRDIAQELVNTTSFDTVAVRSPGSGAVVSDIHTRASLEAAQQEMLGTPDYVEGASLLVRDVTTSPLASIDWAQMALVGGVGLAIVIVIALIFARRQPMETHVN
ncbi:hypothetical protein HMPREF0290_1696 [Corynebacterium efficiens YS-314]|uniref:Uncharacterized protein n=1 Tax=Corynebacterium efficiens (strain DSM 44549 / YS-314 / AJ 12310 / JCM 11189 / NBRC 100395) TaxID=196164 RepID=Q8FTA9_COREF|nr:DUF6676 family protein [Corynebacterium efficiens]EEW49689.1 hypothetical protein HMPREF0290_1696 [Corynebacterium efficiens YS-314]BAC18470.1 hypothetical protein [Corynebacterium efficiens YS-314]